MAFDALIRSAIATADSVLESLQADVVHHAWIADGTTYGDPQYATPAITRSAIIEQKQRMRRMADGREILQLAVITFPRPIAANGAANRREPIDPRDKLVLPNGFTGPIADVSSIGPIDPTTGSPYGLEVIIGTVVNPNG